MNRFFVDKKTDNLFIIDDEQYSHLKVIRALEKEFIVVFESKFYKVKLVDKKHAEIIEELNLNHEYDQEVVLAVGLIDWNRFEFILEKATELGATKIIPFTSNFTNFNEQNFERKKARFMKIIKAAAQQSFRNQLPILNDVIKYENLFKNNHLKNIYLAHSDLNDSQNKITSFDQNCLLIVGPEGGFNNSEIDFALNNNAKIISLGKTILRAETAALKMLSLVK
ncbi:16S rRNA (uracil(1498)-N(3))-methyltransferase [Mycoplasmopsis agassizii]|uniref:16S rRNA (uracil(1498)-N(3))-methyltransferase n=1 Tax=Mycoplasmopsis agassizii TaxID=33922 RepID=UPI0035284A3D